MRLLRTNVWLGLMTAVVGFSACGEDTRTGEPMDTGEANSDGDGGAGGSGVGTAKRPTCTENDLYLIEELTDGLGGFGGSRSVYGSHALTEKRSGLIQCTNQRINRSEALSCGAPLPFYQPHRCDGFSDVPPSICETFNWKASQEWEMNGDDACELSGCIAIVGCVSDAECGQDEACVCASGRVNKKGNPDVAQVASVCVPATCKTNADCDSGECGAIVRYCGYNVDGFACRTERDECTNDKDCPTARCGYSNSEARWVCQEWADCE